METKIIYWYCNKEYTIDISNNEHLLTLIKNEIYIDKQPNITHPNDEADDKIRKFVDDNLRQEFFYKGTGHASKIIIYEETNTGKYQKLHEINGTFSNATTQKIIKQIKKRNKLIDDATTK